MQLIHKDLRKGLVKVKIESQDDLWTLHLLLGKGDIIHGKTYRKRTVGEEKTEKKSVHLSLSIEKVEFAKMQPVLRVLGKIIAGPDDVPRGSYHSFALEPESVIEVEKQSWQRWQYQRLEEAAAEKKKTIVTLCHGS